MPETKDDLIRKRESEVCAIYKNKLINCASESRAYKTGLNRQVHDFIRF